MKALIFVLGILAGCSLFLCYLYWIGGRDDYYLVPNPDSKKRKA